MATTKVLGVDKWNIKKGVERCVLLDTMNEAFWINHQQAHQNFGCGLVDIGNNNLSKLQGQCEKTNKSQSVWRTCKTFPTSAIGDSLGPLPHELKLILPSRSITLSLLVDSGWWVKKVQQRYEWTPEHEHELVCMNLWAGMDIFRIFWWWGQNIFKIFLCHVGMTWKIFYHMYMDESHKMDEDFGWKLNINGLFG